ncbi:hypothetical protein HY844_02715 [Candidatus Berkelbacteria bacterium]|nr:hypothetical protein [Candidatus Berkelbacteria bacterium]
MARYKVVVYVPTDSADLIREVVGKAGGGKNGNYSMCSFTSKGEGRFFPNHGANPAIGKIGKLEIVEEDKIEFDCDEVVLDLVVEEIKKNHPYEEVVYNVYKLEN